MQPLHLRNDQKGSGVAAATAKELLMVLQSVSSVAAGIGGRLLAMTSLDLLPYADRAISAACSSSTELDEPLAGKAAGPCSNIPYFNRP